MDTATAPHTSFYTNMLQASSIYQDIVKELLNKQFFKESLVAESLPKASHAFTKLWEYYLHDPEKLWLLQCQYCHDFTKIVTDSTKRFMGEIVPPLSEQDSDPRFNDRLWQDHPYFTFLKQSYKLTSTWVERLIQTTEGLDKQSHQQIDFYTRQCIDALSPSNFLLTNPKALQETIASHGMNIVNGLKNFLHDIQSSKGKNLLISSAKQRAFEFGKTIAATEGKVIYQNDLMQLIHYTPTTPHTFSKPLLIIPAWINKYYIFDLQPQYSMIRWLVSQGFSVFIISWVNPDKTLQSKTFEDYLVEGPIKACDIIQEIIGCSKILAMGYCLGGTLLSCMLATMKAQKDSRIEAATFLTTLIDFSEAGQLGLLLDEAQIDAIEARMNKQGVLSGDELALTFNMLKANDMIWSFVVNNYLLGKEPFPFDLLTWNADSTSLPAAMHSFYLRHMYQRNLLVRPGGVTLCGIPVDLFGVTTPSYFLSTKDDHIAPWATTYAANGIFSGPIRFVLSGSGHVAGVMNHPDKHKYQYWTNEHIPHTPKDWFGTAIEHQGSWWNDWLTWITPLAGEKVRAKIPGQHPKYPSLSDAPGSYVLQSWLTDHAEENIS